MFDPTLVCPALQTVYVARLLKPVPKKLLVVQTLAQILNPLWVIAPSSIPMLHLTQALLGLNVRTGQLGQSLLLQSTMLSTAS